MLAHVPSFGRNPRGSPDFLAYPVPKACMHVLGTWVPRRLGVARSASSPKAALALGCSLTPGLRISFGRVTCMARAASVPGLWALGFLLLACVCGWVRVAVGCGFCLSLPVVAGVLGWCAGPGSRLCPALLGLVVGVCFLRFFVFFFPVARCPCPGPCGLSPHPLSFGLGCWLFFFSWCVSACFGAPFPGGPLFLACCCRFWLVGPPVPLWGSCLRCPLGGGLAAFCVVGARFGGCGLFCRAPPSPPLPPPFFFPGWGAAWLFLPLPPLGWRSLCGWWVVWLVPRHSWRWFLCATPRHSWLGFAAGVGGRSRPLLAGVRWRRWCVVWCVWQWCVGRAVAGVWRGWSLATPGGGSCVLLPATPGWVSLPVVVGGPRHSWLGSAGGVGVWCGVCGGGVLVGLWLVCGVVGPSPLLAEVPVCYSPPLLAGFRCRWWWAVPATPGWGLLAALVCGVVCVAVVCWWGCGWCVVWLVPRHSWRRFLCATPRHSWLGFAAGGGGRSPPLLAGVRWRRWCVVCGVWRWCVGGVVGGVWCGWSLTTPGGGSGVLLPATPGWVSPPVVVGGPRHSWLGSAGGGGVWCVVCDGGVLVGLWLVCGVVGPSPLLAEVPVCYSPPLLAGFRCRWWWAVPDTPGCGPLAALVCSFCCVWRWCVGGVVAGVWCGWSLATPGGGSCVLLPATPGWVSLPVLVGGPRHSWPGSAGGVGVWCAVFCAGVLVGLWLVCGVVGSRHSWRRFLCATPRHSWLGFAAGVGGRSPPLLAGVRWRRWCVVCGVWRWCVGGVVAGVWCGWSLATPGGGSCVLLPATPGWVSLPVVVSGPCHSWLGSAGGGGVWCVVAWPGRAGRPPGRVLVRLTFSFGRFVFLLCLAPSGLGLPPSLSLLCFGCLFFFGLPLLGSLCARASFVSPAWPLAALSWLLPRPPPLLCLAVFVAPAWCLGFFFFLLLLPLCAPVVSGFLWFPAPGALGLGACVVCFVGLPLLGSPCACPSFLLPPPPLCVSRFLSLPLGAVCRVVLCVPGCGAAARFCAFCRPVLCCRVLCCALLVPLLVALRSAALCFAVFPRAVCVVSWRGGACCVCLGVLCCAFPVLSTLCGAVLRCAGALALCCSCGACCCWRLVLWCAAVCCAVSCGVPWCGAGSGGPWLSASGVFRCRCPCLAAWSASLWLVWFAVVPCFSASCSVVLCCRVVLCCCALLSCCGAVGACFALLWAVVLCCVVLLVGCAVFCPVVVSACCGALFLVLCVPCLLRSVRCGALLCWLWCPASLCRVLWRCAVVWCCAVVLCCPFAVLFVFALPSCGLSCGASVVCAVVGASCCGVFLCVVVSPWAFCGVVVLLWCVVVSCCAVRCGVVSCALCRVLRCRAALRCCAGWLCCAVVCAAGVCFSFCPLFHQAGTLFTLTCGPLQPSLC